MRFQGVHFIDTVTEGLTEEQFIKKFKHLWKGNEELLKQAYFIHAYRLQYVTGSEAASSGSPATGRHE